MQLVKKTETEGKECYKCGEHKPLEEFGIRKSRGKESWRGVCKTCRYEDNRNNRYIKLFGITIDDYNQMFTEQEGKCGCCGKHQVELNKRLAVDHDHDTGEVRGLLCTDCNVSIGKLGDNTQGLEQALRYLNGDTERNSDRR